MLIISERTAGVDCGTRPDSGSSAQSIARAPHLACDNGRLARADLDLAIRSAAQEVTSCWALGSGSYVERTREACLAKSARADQPRNQPQESSGVPGQLANREE